ncbi:hypothetical protein [Pelagicoccus mobilis]|uniref:Tetratricopeptide repeat protein n=1 Tax=Pelagicoccus mobilis TaxID=415221 RepID=A0A934S0Y3_9BACT|nr:hypothetical protein [Pelagicoccus mobilis]MBK1880337.1 hypothetical protein [Pelagicoccus mobilis]
MHRLLHSLFLVCPTILLADQVDLRNGESITGQLADMKGGYVNLLLPEAEGEAIQRIHPDQILHLAFDDHETPLQSRALTRAKFIPLLSESDSKILLEHLSILLLKNQSTQALRLAKTWHPKNEYNTLDATYRNIIIESALASGQTEEALIHSQNWLKQKPPPFEHPQPWEVLAQNHLKNGDPRAALWTSLSPIAHGNHENESSLAKLHLLSAEAYQKLGYNTHANAHLSLDQHSLLTIPTQLKINP